MNPPRHFSFYQEHLHATAHSAKLGKCRKRMALSSEQEALCRRLEMGRPEPSAAALIRQQARDWSRAYLAVRREIPSDELRREIEEVRAHLERQRTIGDAGE